MLREISLVLHIVGVLLWIGGSASAAWTAAQLALVSSAEQRKEGLLAVRRALLAIVTPGLLLAWAGGLTMFFTALDVYSRAGWMHGKLTIGIVVAALHGVLVARVRKGASGEREVSQGFFGGVAMTIVVLAAVVVALVIFRPGS
ncbi:CopD family protein [Sandaracinus amylolyticus]|uniref:Protoporphyrinogen IX oxidase n=1 Tax=Sandaracinus amylolyticus TaxID=927083 RepID=A0A0F6YKT0_9BACT|nr:CopD family protein [Sandaracinus amylolyticus]AKF07566.1 hypothetical protein DB32_004715 [Sandaracinus amylolyticus]